jgi:hypothetical protein
MTELIFASRDLANAPKTQSVAYIRSLKTPTALGWGREGNGECARNVPRPDRRQYSG